MTWNVWIRQAHRWLGMILTVSVVATAVALALPEPVLWMSYVPLLPLFLLLVSGLYLFVLPYRTRRRAART